MGWLIEGLGGACNPEHDFWRSVEYYKLSEAMEVAYGIIPNHELSNVQDAEVLPRTYPVLDEHKATADMLVSAYQQAAEASRIWLWRNNIRQLVRGTTMTQLIETEIQEEEECAAEKAANRATAETVWNAMSAPEQGLCQAVKAWEKANWANAFKASDSPFLTLPDEFKTAYNAVYDFYL